MYRISITTLEGFRKVLCGASEYDTEEKFAESLKNPFQGNEYTRIGTAFHQIVELGESTIVTKPDHYEVKTEDGYTVKFNLKQVMTALNYRLSLPFAFHEQTIGRVFNTKSMPIWVGGRCDVLHGTFVRDIKTKYSPIKYADYADSAQWRLYLDLLGLDTFYFDLFEFKGYKIAQNGYDVSGLEIVTHEPIECIRYDLMQQDNQKLVETFTDWITIHNYEQYLKIHE